MEEIMQRVSKKIAAKRSCSLSKSKQELNSFLLNRTSIKNALSRNRDISVTEKLKLVKSFEKIKQLNQTSILQTQDILVKQLNAGCSPTMKLKRRKLAKQKIIILKTKEKSRNNQMFARSFEAKTDNPNSTMMLSNVQDLLFPSLSRKNDESSSFASKYLFLGHLACLSKI